MCRFRTTLRTSAAVALAGCLLPAAASAGTFHVYGLGTNDAGCPNGWQAQSSSPDKFVQRDQCSIWMLESNRDGHSLASGDFAGLSMFAGEGARFTGFSIRSTGTARNGAVWKMAMCRAPFYDCQSHFPQSGTWYEAEFQLGNVAPGIAPYYAQHLWAGAICEASSCADSAASGRAVSVTHMRSHAIVEDFTAPGAPNLSGVSTAWNSGAKELAYSASDAGSGIAAATLTIDGSLQRENVHGCARVPAGGYSEPVPCATSTGGTFTVNQPGQLADGRHSLTVAVRDASGETGSASQEFLVDNNAPSAPLAPVLDGSDGWRATNDFSVSWANPDQGSGSPVAAAYYKVGAPPAGPRDGVRVAGDGISRIDGIRLPADGDWPVHVWLEDAAGNAQHAHASTVRARLDTAPPTVAFATARDPRNPAEVRVHASDRTSGIAGGQIEIRRDGAAAWQALETGLEGSELVASIPDERFARGTYELQATAWDAPGNRATTATREDGRPMVLELPLRDHVRVSAVLTRRELGAHGASARLRVPYRTSVRLRGALRSGGQPLARAPLSVYTRRLGSRGWRPLSETLTNDDGRYRVGLGEGVSRDVRVRFGGDRGLRPAEDIARLRVRATATLRLRPNRLRRGGTIAFVGRVGVFRATVPRGGKLVQIQYLDGRRWRPAVKLGRTDGRGRFAIRYRFRRISRPTRIYFRILVPAESAWPYTTGWSRIRVAHVRP